MNTSHTDIDDLRARRNRLARTGSVLMWLAVLMTFGALFGGIAQLLMGIVGPDPAMAWWIMGGGMIGGRIVGAIASRFRRHAELLSRDLIKSEAAAGVIEESTVSVGAQLAVTVNGAIDARALHKGNGQLALTAVPSQVQSLIQQAREAIFSRSRRGVLQSKVAILVGVGLIGAGITALVMSDFDGSSIPVFAGTLIPGVLIALFGLIGASTGLEGDLPRASFAEDTIDALCFDEAAPLWAHLRIFEADAKGPWLQLSGTLANGTGLVYERSTLTHAEFESVKLAKHVHSIVISHAESYFVDKLTLKLAHRDAPFTQHELAALANRMQLPGSARITGIEATGRTLHITIAGAHDLDPGSYLSDVSRDVARSYSAALGTALAA